MFDLIQTGLFFLAVIAGSSAGRDRRQIIGGEKSTIELHPYQVSLSNEDIGGHFCGGSIISEYFVLTAGHCMAEFNETAYDSIFIRAGSSIWSTGGSLHNISNVIIHEEYYLDDGVPVNDVALIEVEEPFEFDESRQPVPLYETNETAKVGEPAVISGWGLTEDGPTEVLQTVTVEVMPTERCEEAYEVLYPGTMCAGTNDHKYKDSCYGDSGGPLVVGGRLAGVVSWGLCFVGPIMPGVYADVGYYREWIEENTQIEDLDEILR